MILELHQTKKDLFYAEFAVNHSSDGQMGNVTLQGRLDSMEVEGKVFFKENRLDFSPGNLSNKVQNLPRDRYCFRPYNIKLNGAEFATIYQTKHNGGFRDKYEYLQMLSNGDEFYLYPIGFGKEGSKSPIYKGDTQIGQIDKDCLVLDDLHHYKIYVSDGDYAIIALCFGIYMYINAAYKPGTKVTSSKVFSTTRTTNKALKSKFNPSFASSVKN